MTCLCPTGCFLTRRTRNSELFLLPTVEQPSHCSASGNLCLSWMLLKDFSRHPGQSGPHLQKPQKVLQRLSSDAHPLPAGDGPLTPLQVHCLHCRIWASCQGEAPGRPLQKAFLDQLELRVLTHEHELLCSPRATLRKPEFHGRPEFEPPSPTHTHIFFSLACETVDTG